MPWLLARGGIYLLSQRYHALPSFSQPEMVGRRFGRSAKRLVAVALVFVFLVWGGAEIYVAANLLAPGLAVSTIAMILIIAVVVGTYGTMGGFRAVVNTDKLQYGVVVLYLFAMAWLTWIGLRQAGSVLAAGAADPLTAGAADGAALGNPALAALTGRRGAKSGLPWSHALAPGIGIIALTFAAYLPGWIFYLSSGVLTTTVAFPVAAVFLPWATPDMVTASAAAAAMAAGVVAAGVAGMGGGHTRKRNEGTPPPPAGARR